MLRLYILLLEDYLGGVDLTRALLLALALFEPLFVDGALAALVRVLEGVVEGLRVAVGVRLGPFRRVFRFLLTHAEHYSLISDSAIDNCGRNPCQLIGSPTYLLVRAFP